MTKLMGRVPSRSAEHCSILVDSYLTIGRSILLLEDLDAAFTRGVSRDEKSTGAPAAPGPTEENGRKSNNEGESTLSLSGLLNSLDGVAAAEGR